MMKRTEINVTINATNKEDTTMKRNMSENTKMEILKEAGINPNDMLQFLLKNADIEVVKGEVRIKEKAAHDPILQEIINKGYAAEGHLFRRWVMAQMFEMLNSYVGYNDYLDRVKTWEYQVDFLIDEVDRIIKIERSGDKRTLKEYTRICTLPVICEILIQICEKTEKELGGKFARNIWYVEKMSAMAQCAADAALSFTYREMRDVLKDFRSVMFRLPNGTKKVPAFKDMYKGIGAYWTCKNLIMFHGCKVGSPFHLNTMESMEELEKKAKEYFATPQYFRDDSWHESEGGYRMFAFMKKLIKDNNFDFNARMRQIYAEKRNQ